MRGCHSLTKGRMGKRAGEGETGVCCYTEVLAEDLKPPIRAQPFITYNIKHTSPFFNAGRCVTRGWCRAGQSAEMENRIKMLIYGILEANIKISVGAVTADVDRLHHGSY